MSFLDLFVGLPFSPIQLRVGKKVKQILVHCWLIVFGDQQVIALIGMYPRTPFPLRMHRIGTDDASFQQEWMQQGPCCRDLIFFARHCLLRHHDATFTLVERDQMHRWLRL